MSTSEEKLKDSGDIAVRVDTEVEDFKTTIRCKDGQERIISWNSRRLPSSWDKAGGTDHFERYSLTTDGASIPVEIRTNKIEYSGKPAGCCKFGSNILLTID